MNMTVSNTQKSSSLITVSGADAEGMEKEIPIPLSLNSAGMELLRRSLSLTGSLWIFQPL